MNVNNRPVGMIYFKTPHGSKIIEELNNSFGKFEQGQYPYEYWWHKVNRPEWSKEPLDIKILKTKVQGDSNETLSVAILNSSGEVLTDKNSSSIGEIKSYFESLRKTVN
jgi:hypothetical protein